MNSNFIIRQVEDAYNSGLAMLRSNIRFAARAMVASPGTTVAAIIALALGIGGSASIFSILNTILLRPLPYPNADRLVVAWAANPGKKIPQFRVSPLNYLDYKNLNRSLRLGSFREGSVVLTGRDLPEKLESSTVSPDLFEILGVAPRIGTNFRTENGVAGKDHVALLADALWKGKFGGDERIIGKPIVLDGEPYTVVGVMPAGFRLLDQKAEIFIPHALSVDEASARGRGFSTLFLAGRLNDGVSIEQGRSDVEAIAARLAEQYAVLNNGWTLRLIPLAEQMSGDTRGTLFALLGAVCFVLLIACANVASLLLARAGGRQKEIAVRAALGASPWAVVSQLLVESVVLSLTGGLFGLGIAWIAIRALERFGPANLPRLSEISIDPWVVGFTLGVAIATGILFGLAPALTFARIDLNSVLRSSGRSSSGDAKRTLLRNALVVGEVALTMVLLTGCGLLLRSLWALEQVDRGYQVGHLLTFKIALPETRYKELAIARFYQRLLENIHTLPGVELAGMTRDVPLSGSNPTLNFTIEGAPPLLPADQPRARFRLASADYFKALQIPLIRGRYFETSDSENSQPVVVINEAVAAQMFPNVDPLGRRIQCGFEGSPYATIIGIVKNTRSVGLDSEPGPETFYPYLQVVPSLMYFVESTATIVVRAKGDPDSLINSTREAVRRMDPDLAVFQAKTMEEMLATSVAQPRFRTLLIVAFAGAALVLAMIGLYSVLAFSVSQRTQEIGVRVALGATASEVLKLVIGQGLRLAVIGVVLGLAASFFLARLIEKLLFGVKPWDAEAFVVMPLLLLVVAFFATYLPARRALKIDPLIALRSE